MGAGAVGSAYSGGDLSAEQQVEAEPLGSCRRIAEAQQ